MNMASLWTKLTCNSNSLNLGITLSCGQAFRWQNINNGEWRGVLFGRVWTLKENEDGIVYKVNDWREGELGSSAENSLLLNDYFQLDVDVDELYKDWSKRDANFKKVALNISGFRLLRQDPVENLFSFICSSNNNIERISKMVESLCIKYGKKVCELDGVVYHSFPTVSRLSEPDVEQELREMKFGYRATFIHQTAKLLNNKNSTWLMSLRSASYAEAHAALCQLPGVGAKVADCVCLMSLDKTDAIPVDTHVWQISLRDYSIPGLKKNKSLTDRTYRIIGDYFRGLFGKHAGWANSVLFSSDLKKFQSLKTGEMRPPSDKEEQSRIVKRKQCDTELKEKRKKIK